MKEIPTKIELESFAYTVMVLIILFLALIGLGDIIWYILK